MSEGAPDIRTLLTPAEQMLKIRDAVIGNAGDEREALEKLAAYLQSTDRVQERLRDLESRAWIRETEFRSNAPIIGGLIVAIRNLWNWMSTKWYILPMLQQQNSFNSAAAQMIRDLWTMNRTLLSALAFLQHRVDELEQLVLQLRHNHSDCHDTRCC